MSLRPQVSPSLFDTTPGRSVYFMLSMAFNAFNACLLRWAQVEMTKRCWHDLGAMVTNVILPEPRYERVVKVISNAFHC